MITQASKYVEVDRKFGSTSSLTLHMHVFMYSSSSKVHQCLTMHMLQVQSRSFIGCPECTTEQCHIVKPINLEYSNKPYIRSWYHLASL